MCRQRPPVARGVQQFRKSLRNLSTLFPRRPATLYTLIRQTSAHGEGDAVPVPDELDGRLLRLLDAEPRLGVLECSRRLGVARGTVQARLDRLRTRGVIFSLAPHLDPAALGYPVTAFATLEIYQGSGPAVREHLASVPEVLEVHTTTGAGDMLCRIVARSNEDLQQVIDRVLGFPGIFRASTAISMENPVPYRVLPLVRRDTVPEQPHPTHGAGTREV